MKKRVKAEAILDVWINDKEITLDYINKLINKNAVDPKGIYDYFRYVTLDGKLHYELINERHSGSEYSSYEVMEFETYDQEKKFKQLLAVKRMVENDQ